MATGGNLMKHLLLVSGTVALMLAFVPGGSAQDLDGASSGKSVLYVAAQNAKFDQSPMPGVSMAIIWGDPALGAHATFTKFAPGHDSGMHSHTNDLWIVVIKGAYLYKDEDGEKRVGPGDFIRVPGGRKHWSGGDKKEGALFYEEGGSKFDLIPAK
jgi:quercetin dioxygenase-like cupin family protein